MNPRLRIRHLLCSTLFLGLAVPLSPCSASEPTTTKTPVVTADRSHLPAQAKRVLDKFAQFESAKPSASAWETKRRDVLRYLKSVFEAEAAKANLEGAVAIREAAKSLKSRQYRADPRSDLAQLSKGA